MSRESSSQSEDDLVWNANDVEKSLLHNERNRLQNDDDTNRRNKLGSRVVYSVMSFCCGALLSLAIVLSIQGRAACGSLQLPDNGWIEETELRDAASGSYTNIRFDGALIDRSSPYKGPPSPEVDALWHQVTGLGVMSISEQVFEHLNASKYAVKVPESLGGGRMAIFETIHQIHCVQALWHAAYPDYYPEQQEYRANHPEQWYAHIDHCADMLRQKLMCDADTGLVTYNWVKGHSRPHPNFSVQHQCRDFGAVLQFARDHQLDKDNSEKIDVSMLRPENERIMEFEGEPPFDPDAVPLQGR